MKKGEIEKKKITIINCCICEKINFFIRQHKLILMSKAVIKMFLLEQSLDRILDLI